VDAEIPSPTAGVVVEILVEVGAIVPVGTALARIDSDASAAAAAPQIAAASTVADVPASATVAAPAADGPKATPLARRIAEQADVDLASVHGSGAAGRVTKEDVERHLAAAAEPVAPAAAPAPPASAPVAPPSAAPARRAGRPAFMNYTLQPEDKVIPMSPLRRLVAEHMVLSKHTSPHVGTVAEIDFGGIFRLREQHKRAFKEAHGFSLSYLPFIVHATVRALREFPALNASVVEDAIVEKQAIHIGVAVETEKGLVVPVLRHADRLSLSGLAQAIDDIADRARSKRLSPDELQGGTFTISNPGREGNLYGFAIINQPQVGILRMGEIVKRPVVITQGGEDAIVIRPMMYLALSYDHRAVDGAPANGFLHRIRSLLEEAEFDI
jgi:2-oxoglutarate dehydrogenase E2 component (dihydrolipoamide succinyltransferase)